MGARAGAAAAALMVLIAGTVAAGGAFPETLTSTVLSQPAHGQVVEAQAVCPGLTRSADGGEAATVFVDPDATASTGQIAGASQQPSPLPPAGQAVRVVPAEPGGAITVTATGATAASTATVREYFDGGEEGRGLALASCLEPRAQWWFVGVSGAAGHIDELLLANPTGSPAVVSVDLYGPAGDIEVVGVGGVVVQPGGQSVIRMDSLIPGVSTATLRVTTSGGIISAALRSTAIDGLIPLGAEYLPPAAAPASTMVVPGVLSGAGRRELVLTATDQDAAVKISYLTEQGRQERPGTARIPVPAGHTVAVDIHQELNGKAAAVLITASADVTAAVRSTVAATLPPDATGVLNRVPVADMAWTAGAGQIVGQLLLPLAGRAEAPGVLVLSSTDGPSTATITTRAATGQQQEQVVQVKTDTTQVVPVPVTADSASLITVSRTAGAGRLYAAVVQSGSLANGPIAAAAIGADPSTEVTIPLAYPDPQVLAGS